MLALLAGCGSGGLDSAAERPEASGPTSSADPWVVPDPIDIAYVQRVVNEIEEQRDFLLDEVYASHQLSELSKSRLRAIYAQPYLEAALDGASKGSMEEHPDVKADSAPARVPVKFIRSVRSDCINAIVDVDDSPALSKQAEVMEFAVTLRRATSVADSNITQWQESNWDATSADNGKVDRCAQS
jgi:hypothetical protein